MTSSLYVRFLHNKFKRAHHPRGGLRKTFRRIHGGMDRVIARGGKGLGTIPWRGDGCPRLGTINRRGVGVLIVAATATATGNGVQFRREVRGIGWFSFIIHFARHFHPIQNDHDGRGDHPGHVRSTDPTQLPRAESVVKTKKEERNEQNKAVLRSVL